MRIILYLPYYISIPLLLLLTVLITIVGLKIVNRVYKRDVLQETHQITSYIFNAFGLMFAVLVAFVVYINWSNYDSTQGVVYDEVNHLSNLFHLADGFGDSLRGEIKNEIINYTDIIQNDDWNSMQNMKQSDKARVSYDKLWNIFLKMDYDKFPNKTVYHLSALEIKNLSESRRTRYFYMEDTIPVLIWIILIVGSIMSILLSCMFAMNKKSPHYFSVMSFVFINLILLYLIYILDHPFTGRYSISAEPYINALSHFRDVMMIIVK
jgi:hypothetical protein